MISDSEDDMTCDKCNGKLELAVDEFTFKMYRCLQCGEEYGYECNYNIQEIIDKNRTTPLKQVFLLWKSEPTYKQITYAKIFFPELKNKLNADLVKQYEKEWFMGYFEPEEIQGLGIKGKAKGLEIRIIDAD
jgi:DNA-directed RNA polymerase subunit RPC12/RpoP